MSVEKIDRLCAAGTPFLVITNFEATAIRCYTPDELETLDISFTFEGSGKEHSTLLAASPVTFTSYRDKLLQVQAYIRKGETYLLNLTQPTPIDIGKKSFHEIYMLANAPYKLRYQDKFVCFSPEKFIDIIDDRILTYPMKGTIDASVENARQRILDDTKEMAEHVMIVDLLRNDLGIVANDIRVDRFRYITQIQAGNKQLLQVSSQISGKLPKNWRQNFSSILQALLPAGSISGTPKKRTVEIIQTIENYKRDFFSGIFGYFDGKNFTSAVMIRFIENQGDKVVYKSGGGITIDSDAKKEYREMVSKIYIP